MLQDLIIKTLAGASVGYITNDLAVKMLFRKYFGLGGVVIETKDAFVRDISRLVEQDVIHHHALNQEIQREPFERTLQQVVSDFFQNHLPQAVATDFTIGQIPAIDPTYEALRSTLRQSLAAHWEALLTPLLTAIRPSDLASEAQLKFFTRHLTTWLADFIRQADHPQRLLQLLLADVSRLPLQHFIDQAAIDQIAHNAQVVFADLHQYLRFNFSHDIDQLLEQAMAYFQLDEVLVGLIKMLKDKHIAEIIGDENIKYIPIELAFQIRQIFYGDTGKEVLQTFLRFLFKILRKEKATLFSLLSPKLQQQFKAFLQRELPQVLQSLIGWVQTKKEEIETLVDETFREKSNFIQEILVELFVGSVSEKANIVGKVIEMLENYDERELATQATQALIDFLQNNSIGSIVSSLNETQVIDNLQPLLQEQVIRALENLQIKNLGDFFDQPLSQWLDEHSLPLQIKALLRQSIEDHLLYHPRLSEFTQQMVAQKISELGSLPIHQWLNAAKIPKVAEEICKFLSQAIENRQAEVQAFVLQKFQTLITDKPLAELLAAQDLQALAQWIEKALFDYLDDQFAQLKQAPLHTYLAQIRQIPRLEEDLSLYLKQTLTNNLEQWAEGQVSTLVSENLNRFSNERIRDMVENVMGKELQPISIFGAFLGAITGAMLLLMPVVDNMWFNTALAGVAYGITGWGTNWLAIRMIFRPYQAYRFPGIGWRIPFTPGVLAKNKMRFADSMSDFLGEKLLNPENLQQVINDQQTIAGKKRIIRGKKLFREYLSQDNFAFLTKQLVQNKDRLAQRLSNGLWQYAQKSKQVWQNALHKLIDRQATKPLDNLNTTRFEDAAAKQVHTPGFAASMQTVMAKEIDRQIARNPTLQTLLPPLLREGLQNNLQKTLQKQLQGIQDKIVDEQQWQQLQTDLFGKVGEFSRQSLRELLSASQLDQLSQGIVRYLQKSLKDREFQDKIFAFLDQKIRKEIHPNRRVRELFGGKIMETLEEQTGAILQNLLKKGLEWLQKNKETIASDVYDAALDKNIGAFAFEGTIRKTVFELVDNRLPEFFARQFRELKTLVHQKLTDIGDTPVDQFGLEIESESLQYTFEQILLNPELQDFVGKLVVLIMEERILGLPLETFVRQSPDEIQNLLRRALQPEILYIRNQLQKHLTDPKLHQVLVLPTVDLMFRVADKTFFPTPLQALLKDVAPTAPPQLAAQLSTFLLQAPDLKDKLPAMLHEAFVNLRQKPLAQLISIEQLQNDAASLWATLWQDSPLQATLQKQTEALVADNLSPMADNLANPVKTFLVYLTVDASMATLEKNLADLIQAIDLKKIVQEEVAKMNPKELEDLFYGFAGLYFTHLINYGFGFGVAFGLAVDLGLWSIAWLFR